MIRCSDFLSFAFYKYVFFYQIIFVLPLFTTYYIPVKIVKFFVKLYQNKLLQKEVQRIGAKVDAATLLEKFITNMQRERSEVIFSYQIL